MSDTNALGPGDYEMLPPGVVILATRETSQPAPNGQMWTGLAITFTTPSGSNSTVFVPYAQLTPAVVAAAITERAAKIEAVHNLSNPL